MNLLKKLFSFSNNDNCAIGLCSFKLKNEFYQEEETPKINIKDVTLSQMLKKPI